MSVKARMQTKTARNPKSFWLLIRENKGPHSICRFTLRRHRALRLEQRLRIADGNAKVGPAKAADNGEGHANHLAVAIYQRPTGAAGSSLCIVDNFIRQDVADMSLCH